MEPANVGNIPGHQRVLATSDRHVSFAIQSTHLLRHYLQHDRETAAHSWRVSILATRLAQHLNGTEEEIAIVRLAALLHDIGKAWIPASILHKPTKLNAEEYRLMQEHPVHSRDLLRSYAPATAYWQHISEVVLHHHEHWDGNGYPSQLAGANIPYEARICAVADVWDALISARSYRPAWEPSAVAAHLRAEAGRSLDPQMVEVFLAMQGYPHYHHGPK
jgi:putative nucleotidyltransferase with HDIG domain